MTRINDRSLRPRHPRKFLWCVGVLGITVARTSAAQELEPRSYSASPVGTNFAVIAYGRSSGAIIFDANIPITNVHADIDMVTAGYGRTFNIFGVQGLATAVLPYARGFINGEVAQRNGLPIDSSISRTGMSDLRLKFSANFIGSPALSPPAFATAPARSFIVGASVAVVVPTGQYSPDRLINIGTNRWAFKPEVGMSYNVHKKLYLDFYAGVWLFGDNPDAYPNGQSTKSQDPLLSLQGHVSYTFAKKFWAALDATWYVGGDSHVNNGPPTARQDNTRAGALVMYNITPRQALKLTYSVGATARVGSDFSTIGLGYQYVWF